MTAPSYSRTWLVASLLSLCAVLYALFPTRNYYWDGVLFAHNIENAGPGNPLLFHPNHLLYNWIGFLAYSGVTAIHHVRALYVLQSLSMVAAVLATFAMLGLFQKLGLSLYAQACFGWLFAFSVTWWRFATDADSYILSTLLLVLAFRALLGRRFIACAVLQAAAIAVHELAILFAPVVVLAVARVPQPRSWKAKQLSLYILITGGITGTLYVAAYRLVGPLMGNPGLGRWMTSHSHESSFSFNLAANAIATARSYGRLFVGGRPGLLTGRFGTAPVVASIIVGLTVAAAFIVLSRRLAAYRGAAEDEDTTRMATACSAVWLISYAIFLFFWLPNNTFYKIFVLPPMVILIAVLWSKKTKYGSRQGYGLAVAMAGLFLANFILAILPYSLVGSELVEFSRSLSSRLPASSIVLYSEFVPDDWYMCYFSPQASWIQVHSVEEIRSDYVAASRRGESVWVEATASSLLRQAHIEFSGAADATALHARNGTVMLQRIESIPWIRRED